jgi:hypothetical protein
MGQSATHQDAQLILQLYDLRREPRMRAARHWFITKFKVVPAAEWEKHYPRGSDEDAYFRMVVTYWDMAAALVAHGALNQELFIESGLEFLFVWEKIKEIVPAWRDYFQLPVCKNLEVMANAAIEWMNRQNPKAYETYAARVKSM